MQFYHWLTETATLMTLWHHVPPEVQGDLAEAVMELQLELQLMPVVITYEGTQC